MVSAGAGEDRRARLWTGVALVSIIIELPRDRDRPGSLRLVNNIGITVAGPFPALGRSNNRDARGNGNPDRNPIHPYGDTPYGNWQVDGWVPSGGNTHRSVYSYGPHGALTMRATSGDALVAADNGRTNIYIHSGAPGSQGPEALRPTAGCIRLSNNHMYRLTAAIATLARSDGPPNQSQTVETLNVSIVPVDLENGDSGAGDPPGPNGNWDNFPRTIPPNPTNIANLRQKLAHAMREQAARGGNQRALEAAMRRNQRPADVRQQLAQAVNQNRAAQERIRQEQRDARDQQERARQAAARQEAARQEQQRQYVERQAAQRREQERQARERQVNEHQERADRAAERVVDRADARQEAQERQAQERQVQERQVQERQAQERQAQERQAQERQQRERQEQNRQREEDQRITLARVPGDDLPDLFDMDEDALRDRIGSTPGLEDLLEARRSLLTMGRI